MTFWFKGLVLLEGWRKSWQISMSFTWKVIVVHSLALTLKKKKPEWFLVEKESVQRFPDVVLDEGDFFERDLSTNYPLVLYHTSIPVFAWLLSFSNYTEIHWGSVESYPEMHSVWFISLSYWLMKIVLRSQPIRWKTTTNYDFVTRIFPRFRQFSLCLLWVIFDFSCHFPCSPLNWNALFFERKLK